MSIVSLLFFEIATAVLASAGAAFGLPEFMIGALVLGALAVPTLLFGGSALLHVLFGLYAAAAGLFGLFRIPPLFCAGALAAALVAWDAARVASRVDAAAPPERIRFAVTYAFRSAALAGLGVLLVFTTGAIRVRLTFGSGLALSIAALVLAALFLGTLRRAQAARSDDATGDRR
jgi:hypothetical protein